MISQEQFEEMSAAYVLGILSHDERMSFERALQAATPQDKQVFEQMRLAARYLPVSSELATPSPSVRNNIMVKIGAPSLGPQATFEVTDTSVEPVAKPRSFPILEKLKGFKFAQLKEQFKNVKIDSAFADKLYRILRLDQPLIALALPLVFFFAAMVLFLQQADLRGTISDYEQKLVQQEQSFKTQTIEFSDAKNKLAAVETQLQEQSMRLAELEKKTSEATEQITAKDKELNDIRLANAQNQEIMALLQSIDLKVTDLKGLKPYPQARAKVMFSPKTKVTYIHVANIPPAPANKDYQLWMMEGGKPVSAGVVAVTAGNFIFKVATGLTVPVQKISAFVITLEPKGGLLKPSGPTYLMGNVRL